MPPKKAQPTISADSAEDDTSIDRFETMLVRVTSSISDSFNSCVERLVCSLEQKLNVKLDAQASEIFNVHKEMESIKQSCKDLRAENQALRESVKTLSARLDRVGSSTDEMEQHMRGDNLLIHGVQLPADGSPETNVQQIVLDTLNSHIPELHLTAEHVSVSHRIPQRNQPSTNTAARPPPIIIRFSHRHARNRLLGLRKQLKGKAISVTEQLTAKRAQLLKKASDLVVSKNIQSAWSHDGKVLVKSFSDRIINVHSDADLIQFNS